jgi:O-antigen/teichoic acid export membrane protein
LLRAITRRDLLAGLILLILPLLLFWPVTVGSKTLLPVDNLFAYEPWASYRDQYQIGLPHNQLLSDLVLENYVWKKFIRESLAAGQIPLWNPYILAGQPFLANGQHSALYPFSVIFYLLPLSKAYGWFTVSQLWLAGLAMYCFVRVLGGSRLGALVGAMTYSLSAFFVVQVVFTMIIAAAVWLPLLLALIEIIVRKQEEKGPTGYSPIPYVAAGAVVLGVQTLAGHVEITYYTLLVSGYYTGLRLLILGRKQHSLRFVFRLSLWLLLMVLLGLGLGTVQLGPMYEIVSQNFRDNSVTLDQVRGWALPYRRIISFLIPDFFGSPAHHAYFDVVSRQWQPLGLNAHGEINPLCPNCSGWDTKTSVEAGAYAGILPLALAFLAVIRALAGPWPGGQGRAATNDPPPAAGSFFRAPILIFASLAILSLLFAFGTPLYGLLFYGLPGWNQLHSPFRWIFPYTLSIAVLAGLGLSSLRRGMKMKIAPPPSPPLGGMEGRMAIRPYAPPPSRGRWGGGLFTREAETKRGAGLARSLGWGLFWAGLAGLLVLLAALFVPAPFIRAATFVFDRSGLAQNAFADGRQFLGYQWLNLVKFLAMVTLADLGLGLGPYRVSSPSFLRPLIGGKLRAWPPLAGLIIAVDLLLAGANFNPAVDPALFAIKPRLVAWLESRQAEDPFFRLTSFETPTGRGNKLFLANAAMLYNLFDVRGYDSIIPAQYARFMHLIQENGDLLFNRIGPLYYDGYAALDSALLDLLGVRYVLSTVEINNPHYELVYDDEIRVYENTDALPRAFIVHEEMAAGADLALALRSLDPKRQIILDGANNGLGRDMGRDPVAVPPANEATFSPPERVEIVTYSPNQVRLAASLGEAGWLVLADSYFSGWRALARPAAPNQAPAPEMELTIHRANGNFRAVYLQPGHWEVTFRYSPRSFQLGLYVSFLAAVTLLFTVGYWSWGKLYREQDSDSPIKRVAKNSLVPMVMAVSNRLVDFAFALLMLRILQPEGAGRYAFAVAFIGLTEILTRYGLGTLVTRDVAANRAQSNLFLANVTVLRLYLWLAALPLMGAVLGIYVLYGDVTRDILLTIAILALGTLLSNLSDGLTAIFYAHEKAEYPAAIATITTLSRVSIGALVLLLGWGIIGLAGASLLGNLVAFVILSYILIVKIYRPQLETDRALQKRMMGQSLPLMINHLLATIFFRIDVFVLKPLWGDEAVGFYNAAYKYVDGINIIPQYFTLAIFPLMSRFATDSRESLIRAYFLSLRLLLMLALPLAVGTPFIARELILFLAGEGFLPDSMIVLQLLIWFLPFSFINQVTQYVLIAINQQRHLTRAFIIGVLFNLITNLIFVPIYGYRAAAVTTIFSEWALLIPFYQLVRQHLTVVPWFDIVWRPSLAAAVMGLGLWAIGDVHFVTTIIVAPILYLASLTVLGGFSQPDMPLIWRALPFGRWPAKFGRPRE